MCRSDYMKQLYKTNDLLRLHSASKLKPIHMNYQVHHILIAGLLTILLFMVTGNRAFSCSIPAVFYTGRELWQLSRRKMGKKLDWQGFVPVVANQVLLYFMAY